MTYFRLRILSCIRFRTRWNTNVLAAVGDYDTDDAIALRKASHRRLT